MLLLFPLKFEGMGRYLTFFPKSYHVTDPPKKKALADVMQTCGKEKKKHFKKLNLRSKIP